MSDEDVGGQTALERDLDDQSDVEVDSETRVTEQGARLRVKVKRGTSTNDRDEAVIELKERSLQAIQDQRGAAVRELRDTVESLREFQPDEQGGDA